MKLSDARLCIDCEEIYKSGTIIGSHDTTKTYNCPSCGGKQSLLLANLFKDDRVLVSDTGTILSIARDIKERQFQEEISDIREELREMCSNV